MRRVIAVVAMCLVFGGVAQAGGGGETQTAQGTPAGKFAVVYGAKIHYVDVGSGPVVVLIHGLGDEGLVWQETTHELAKKYRVIVPDLIGHGKSDKPLLSYRTATFVDFFDGLLRELKVERAVLVGNSLGGWIATMYTLQRPEKVSALVLVGAAGFADLQKLVKMPMSALRMSSLGEARELVAAAVYDPKINKEELAVEILRQRVVIGDGHTIATFLESYARGEDVIDGKLGGIRAPTLVIWGREDYLTPLVTGERFRDQIPGAKLEVIEKCSHMPQFECPAPFNKVLAGFLAGVAAR